MDFPSNWKQSEYIKCKNYIIWKGKTNLLWKDWWKQRISNLKSTNRECKQKKRNVNTFTFYFISSFSERISQLSIDMRSYTEWLIVFDSQGHRTNIIHISVRYFHFSDPGRAGDGDGAYSATFCVDPSVFPGHNFLDFLNPRYVTLHIARSGIEYSEDVAVSRVLSWPMLCRGILMGISSGTWLARHYLPCTAWYLVVTMLRSW